MQLSLKVEAGLAAFCVGGFFAQKLANSPMAEPFLTILRFLSCQKLNPTLLMKLIEVTDMGRDLLSQSVPLQKIFWP